jgi:hypothetical protein
MNTIKVKKRQSVYDACIMVYGTITKLNDFLKENDFKADETIVQGQEIVYNSGAGNERIKAKYTKEDITPISSEVVPVKDIEFMDGETFRFMDGVIFQFMNV